MSCQSERPEVVSALVSVGAANETPIRTNYPACRKRTPRIHRIIESNSSEASNLMNTPFSDGSNTLLSILKMLRVQAIFEVIH